MIVIVVKEFEFNGRIYKNGHKFNVISESYRGFDLEDDFGNRIYETRFISKNFEYLDRIREEKIKELGI